MNEELNPLSFPRKRESMFGKIKLGSRLRRNDKIWASSPRKRAPSVVSVFPKDGGFRLARERCSVRSSSLVALLYESPVNPQLLLLNVQLMSRIVKKFVVPAKAGTQVLRPSNWTPACAGATTENCHPYVAS